MKDNILEYEYDDEDDVLYEGNYAVVFRAQKKGEETPIVIKELRGGYPTLQERARFEREHKIALNLKGVHGVIGVDDELQEHKNTRVILMEDGGESLDQFLLHHQLDLEEFLRIGVQVAGALGHIHQQGTIHKDINPSNLVRNSEGEIKIIDFGISTQLPREQPNIQPPEMLEGTLAYIAPEQTGRMNRAIDYRADIYSLGITLYEMITGQLPFQAEDALEMVRCHLAQIPVPPHEIHPHIPGGQGVPKVISDIIMKLMAKEPDDRYQSAFGLQADLKTCLEQFKRHGTIPLFTIGKNDRMRYFRISQKLYGRTQELDTLRTAFDRVRNERSELIIVAGPKGIGKSTLVNELRKPVTAQRGYFISGQCNKDERGTTPYSSFIQAFSSLIEQHFYESPVHLQAWKTHLMRVLGVNAGVMLKYISKLESIIDPQPEVLALPSDKEQNRLLLTFQKFVQAGATADHPLVLVLDDLQWADQPSLTLLEHLLIDPDTQHILFIGTYSDDEDNDGTALHDIQEIMRISHPIRLNPMKLQEVHTFITDTLGLDSQEKSPPPELLHQLAELLHQRTGGNPFFLSQYLQYLHAQQLIDFDGHDGSLKLNMDGIRRAEVPDKMAEFMINKLRELLLSAEFVDTREMLEWAACIGNQFDLHTLAIVSEKSSQESYRSLEYALQKGLVVPIDYAYKYIERFDGWNSESEEPAFRLLNPHFKFLHDQIKQAAYQLIKEERRKKMHLKIGQLLLRVSETEGEERLVEIVKHLNIGREFIIEQFEKDWLAELNMRAGRKIKISDPQQAFILFKNGIDLLGFNSWQKDYQFTLNLYNEVIEAAYLSANFDNIGKLMKEVEAHTITLLDKVHSYQIKLQALIANKKLQEALSYGQQILKLFGISFPKEIEESISQKFIIEENGIQGLLNLSPMTDPSKLAAIRILMEIQTAVFIASPELMPVFSFTGVELSRKYGNAPESATLYAIYAVFLCGNGNIEAGYQFGELSLKLMKQLNATEFEARINFVFNNFIKHWENHLQTILSPLKNTYNIARENGDLLFAAFSIFVYFYNSYMSGRRLDELEQEIVEYGDELFRSKQEMVFHWSQIYRQTVSNLRRESENPCKVEREGYYEKENDTVAMYHFYSSKLILCYLFRDYKKAHKYADKTKKYLGGLRATFGIPIFHFYDSLTLLALYPDVSKDTQRDFLEKVEANQEKMKIWAQHAPMNHEHKWCLVEAERARVLGKTAEAIAYYLKAIRGARLHKYMQEEALAHELMAEFYFRQNMKPEFRARMAKALYCYDAWGAAAKIQHLFKIYPEELRDLIYESKVVRHNYKTQRVPKPKTTTILLETLDKSTVKKSREISQQIQKDFIPKMMQVIMENRGAQKGAYIEHFENQWMIQVLVEGRTEFNYAYNQPLDISAHVPHSIVYYAINNQDEVLLDDASTDPRFESDTYIQTYAPKSVLCFPVENRGFVKAVIYLENIQTIGAFSSERLELLKLLSAQLYMSVENSRQYQKLTEYSQQWKEYSENLEREVAKRTAELRDQKTKLDQENEALQKQVDAWERKIEELQQASKEAEQAQDHFISAMSHDLLTPLNTIGSIAQNLLGELEQHEELWKRVSVIRTTCDVLENQIHDILDLSKIRAGKAKLKIERFDLFSILENVLSMIKVKAEQKGLRLRHTPSRLLPQYVYGDARRLQRILTNLLDNAIKYTQKGQIILKVTCYRQTLDDKTSAICFEIRDTGVGISPEKVETIFQPYKQLNNEALPAAKMPISRGVGLGLSIARQFAHLMGSEISCKSEEGKGSIFRFEVALCEPGERSSFSEDAILQDSFENQEIAGNYVPTVSSQDLPHNLWEELLQSANNSHITNLRKTLIRIQEISENPNLRSFCTKVEQLADNFQFEQISQIVETVMKGAE